ncbi:restriction endonuclease subunit S [Azospirillum sp. B2RO_4]|uniref:restriction endonuclease subunit S n=1 Tax=Azospirillum sp. B2RO_4 TaxID=3027796 RepID=UPI003DA8A67E
MSGREMPAGWTLATLAELGELARGKSKHRPRNDSKLFGDKYPFIQTGDVSNAQGEITSAKIFYSDFGLNQSRLWPKGTLCITIAANIAETAILGFDACFPDSVVGFRGEHACDTKYISYYFPTVKGELQKFAPATAQKNINLETLSNVVVPLPPLPEQYRIVEKIEALTTRVRRAREALDTLPALIDRYRQSILAAAFRGDLTAEWRQHHGAVPGAKEIRESLRAQANILASEKQRPRKRLETALVDDRPSINLSECPSSWAIMTMEEVTDPTRLIQYGILMPGPDVAEGVPYVKVMNIRNDMINVGDLNRTTRDIHDQFRRSELKKNDVLLTIRGTFGRVALVPSELEGGNITQDTARMAPLAGIMPAYIANYLRSPPVQQYLARVAKGVAVRGVNIGDLRPMPVPVPPYEEQLEICRELAKALEAVKRLERYVESIASRCSTLDQSILAKAFRGELVPQDPNDEPASVLLERIRAECAAAGPAPRRGRRPKAADGG